MRASPLLRRLVAVVAVAALALGVRAFVAVPRSVPSVSMLPTLDVGDVFLATRWPFGSPLAARLRGRAPRRGEVVVFRNPAGGGDVVKRVIGLPGDRVALRAGTVLLDGRALARFRVADFVVPETRARPCDAAREPVPGGGTQCRTARWRETLPDGTAWDVLAGADAAPAYRDPLRDMPELTVPPGRLFLLGDNRDRSADSRLSIGEGGLGLVATSALLGRAALILWSSDGSATRDPRSWWRAARRERIGRLVHAR